MQPRPRGACSTRERRSSTSAASRPGRARMASRSTRSCAASCRCSSGSRRSAGLDRHGEGRGRATRARARRRARQRRDGAARRPGARRRRRRCGRVSLPDAHAGRAAHDAARPGLCGRRLRRGGVPRGAAPLRRRARESTSGASASTRASASARPSSRTSSSSARLDVLLRARTAGAVGFSRKSSLGPPPRRPGRRRTGSLAATSPPRSRPTSTARRSSACTTSSEHVEALTVAQRRSRDRRDPRPRGLRVPRRRRGGAARRPAVPLRRRRSRSPSAREDRLEATVDYRAVARCRAGAVGRALVQAARVARGRGRPTRSLHALRGRVGAACACANRVCRLGGVDRGVTASRARGVLTLSW